MYEIMPLGRRNPVAARNPFSIFDEMERAFFNDAPARPYGFRTDIKEVDGAIEIDAELPGFSKEDLDIEIKDDILTISASRKEETEESDDKTRYIRRERRSSYAARSFDVSSIDTDKIEAKYENGILKLSMPKKGEEEPKSVKLAIE